MKKKVISIALVIAMIAILAVGSLTYFTDTDSAKNTFTVGAGVDIELEEPNWVNDPVLMPGTYVEKDPTITVEDDSQDCYLFVELDMARYAGYVQLISEKYGYTTPDEFIANRETILADFIKGLNHADWQVMNLTELQTALAGGLPTHLKVVLGYIGAEADDGVLQAGDEVTVFTEIGLPDWVTVDMEGYKTLSDKSKNDIALTVSAYAIQAAGFDDIDDAYAGLLQDYSDIGISA